MTKRRKIRVVVSSSEEEVNVSTTPRRKLTCSVPASSWNPAEQAYSCHHKKSRLTTSGLLESFDSGQFPGDNFENLFYRSKGLPGNRLSLESKKCVISKNLWVEKYHPASLEELAVHKKKIEEVLSWFEDTLSSSKSISSNNVLLVSGRAGVGKSTTVQLIASHFGARVCEWHAPIPTLWQEHIHNVTSGIQYTSKLDEFVNFVENIRKFGLTTSSFMEPYKSPYVLLLDDLPVANGRHAFEKLMNSLSCLTRSTSIPTVILITDYANSDLVDHNARYMVELQSSLVHSGACKVVFNPITNKSVKKILTKISRLEHCDVGAGEIDLLANSCGGDIRHAITSLQLYCLKQAAAHSSSDVTRCSSNDTADYVDSLSWNFSLLFGRDESLSLFHALGKLLHNKRDTEVSHFNDEANSFIRKKLQRLPLKMDSPERILSLAHGKAGQVADFLHENVLDFMNDDEVDDAWDVSSYLSDSDVILSLSRRNSSSHNEAENILQSVASSVAMRGVLFGNSHPLSSRWHSIRKPKLWDVELHNKNQRQSIGGNYYLFNKAGFSTEFACLSKWLQNRLLSGSLDAENIISLEKEKSSALDDDDIEDW